MSVNYATDPFVADSFFTILQLEVYMSVGLRGISIHSSKIDGAPNYHTDLHQEMGFPPEHTFVVVSWVCVPAPVSSRHSCPLDLSEFIAWSIVAFVSQFGIVPFGDDGAISLDSPHMGLLYH